MISIFDSRTLCVSALSTALVMSTPARAEAISFDGGDGSSQDRAVIIRGAANETEGIRAEHVWQGQAHPRWRWTGDQATFRHDGRLFDLIRLRGPDSPHELWFDITSFFGRS